MSIPRSSGDVPIIELHLLMGNCLLWSLKLSLGRSRFLLPLPLAHQQQLGFATPLPHIQLSRIQAPWLHCLSLFQPEPLIP